MVAGVMKAKVLLFCFVFAICHTASIYIFRSFDFGYFLLSCSGITCDLKLFPSAIFLFALVFFILKIKLLKRKSSNIISIGVNLLVSILIMWVYLFFGTLFFFLELDSYLLDNQYAFMIIVLLFRTFVLFSLIKVIELIAKKT